MTPDCELGFGFPAFGTAASSASLDPETERRSGRVTSQQERKGQLSQNLKHRYRVDKAVLSAGSRRPLQEPYVPRRQEEHSERSERGVGVVSSIA